jgi:ABC-type transport system involved in multi-copper enzyme maturation permease subunit
MNGDATPRGGLLASIEQRLTPKNPVWRRELTQALRLQRTPIILAVLTGAITLLIAGVGGLASINAEPAVVGNAIYHTYFSLAFAVVTWVGPAVAASSVASERSGNTWETLLLTGLSPGRIARGKLLASLSYLLLYIVMLAPVGAMPFLFGGVTAAEVMIAFVLLFVIGAVAVAFGLAVSSKFSSPAAALIVTLIVAVPLSSAFYLLFGPLLSIWAHELWPVIERGPPVWLPAAYARADFGIEYLVFLVAAPIAALGMPAWLFYEVAVANMSGTTDDRSTRLRAWFVSSSLLLLLVLVVSHLAVDSVPWLATSLIVYALFLWFAAFLFAGEPLGPSRRVELHFERHGAGRLRRFFGPGLMNAMTLLFVQGLAGGAILLASGLAAIRRSGVSLPEVEGSRLVAVAGYLAAFGLLVIGLMAFLRARARSGAAPRLIAAGVLFLVMVAPLIASAVLGAFGSRTNAMVLAAPSPFYIAMLIEALGPHRTPWNEEVMAGVLAMAGWALIGTALYAAASIRAERIVGEHRDYRQKLEAALKAELAPAEPQSEAALERA